MLLKTKEIIEIIKAIMLNTVLKTVKTFFIPSTFLKSNHERNICTEFIFSLLNGAIFFLAGLYSSEIKSLLDELFKFINSKL